MIADFSSSPNKAYKESMISENAPSEMAKEIMKTARGY
jgi:hypothetical protein